MAFYENRHEHYNGALVLFQRNLSVAVPNSKTHRQPNWYMRLKIAGHKGYITRSTKLAKYEEAFVYAQSCQIAFKNEPVFACKSEPLFGQQKPDGRILRKRAEAPVGFLLAEHSVSALGACPVVGWTVQSGMRRCLSR